jgi:tetratricopeptide (TPR) repeat protein
MVLASSAAAAAPYVPTDPSIVIERLPAERAGSMLRALRSSTSRDAYADPTVSATLARRFIERSRAEADPRLLGYAQGLLMPWWTDPDAPTDVILIRAMLKQAQHQFQPALIDLDRVLARRPDDGQARLTRAMVLRVQGRYTEAGDACARWVDAAPSFAGTVCLLIVRGLSGDLTGALAAMEALQESSAKQDPSIRSWFDIEYADMLERAQQRDRARASYVQALQRTPGDPTLIAAYADFLLDSGSFAEAEALTGSLLQIDALRLRHAIALKRQGKPTAKDVAALTESFVAAHRRGEELHLREEARFVLELRDDAARALDLARRNWAVQKEPWDARLLLEAADAARDPRAAQPVLDWISASKLQDARMNTGTRT